MASESADGDGVVSKGFSGGTGGEIIGSLFCALETFNSIVSLGLLW